MEGEEEEARTKERPWSQFPVELGDGALLFHPLVRDGIGRGSLCDYNYLGISLSCIDSAELPLSWITSAVNP